MYQSSRDTSCFFVRVFSAFHFVGSIFLNNSLYLVVNFFKSFISSYLQLIGDRYYIFALLPHPSYWRCSTWNFQLKRFYNIINFTGKNKFKEWTRIHLIQCICLIKINKQLVAAVIREGNIHFVWGWKKSNQNNWRILLYCISMLQFNQWFIFHVHNSKYEINLLYWRVKYIYFPISFLFLQKKFGIKLFHVNKITLVDMEEGDRVFVSQKAIQSAIRNRVTTP